VQESLVADFLEEHSQHFFPVEFVKSSLDIEGCQVEFLLCFGMFVELLKRTLSATALPVGMLEVAEFLLQFVTDLGNEDGLCEFE